MAQGSPSELKEEYQSDSIEDVFLSVGGVK